MFGVSQYFIIFHTKSTIFIICCVFDSLPPGLLRIKLFVGGVSFVADGLFCRGLCMLEFVVLVCGVDAAFV